MSELATIIVGVVICPYCDHLNSHNFQSTVCFLTYIRCRKCKKIVHICRIKGNKSIPIDPAKMIDLKKESLPECIYCSHLKPRQKIILY